MPLQTPYPQYPSSYEWNSASSSFARPTTSFLGMDNVRTYREIKDIVIGGPVSAGTGFTSAPSVTITAAAGDSGSGATATATVDTTVGSPTNGRITAITVTAGGSGYAATPVVSFSGGDGVGAAAWAFIENGVVTQIVVNSAEYPTDIKVGGFEPTNSTDVYSDFITVLTDTAALITSVESALTALDVTATATAVMGSSTNSSGRAIVSITVAGGGAGYESNNPPLVTISEPSTTSGHATTTATATAVVANGQVTSITLNTPGLYTGTAVPTVTVAAPGIAAAFRTLAVSNPLLSYAVNMDARKFYDTIDSLQETNFWLNRMVANLNQIATSGPLGDSRYPSGQNRGY